MWEGPGFVDHHAHLIAMSATGPYFIPGGIQTFHARTRDVGVTPMDDTTAVSIGIGLEHAASLGLVHITEAGVRDASHVDALKRLRDQGPLPIRVRLLIASGLAERAMPARIGDAFLDVIGVKFYADGWLGPRTCALREPFEDGPKDEGILFLDTETLVRRAQPFADAGWTIATHAIGDRAIEAVLDAYARIYGNDCRAASPRIEHAQVLSPELIARIAEMGIVACIQPAFAHSDSTAAIAALGDRARDAYAWARLIESGARVISGSDFPIEDLDPLDGLRKLVQGAPVNAPLPSAVAIDLMTDRSAGITTLSVDPHDDLANAQVIDTKVSPT